MSSNINPPKIGKYPHKPHYDVREASDGYSNIAAVLAGFAFAAIVLVIQIPNLPEGTELSRDWAAIAFLVAFIGSLLSSFTFSIVRGEEILSPRSHTVALLGGCGFMISANLIFWGVATIVKVFLSENIYLFIYYSFPIVMAFSLLYVAYSAFDPIISFEERDITWKDYGKTFGPAYFLLIPMMLFKFMGAEIPLESTRIWFNWVMFAALALNLLSAFIAIMASMRDYSYRLPLIGSGLWIGFHAIVLGLLILMT